MTYKSLAEAIGHPKAFRAVGSALRQNPYAPQVREACCVKTYHP